MLKLLIANKGQTMLRKKSFIFLSLLFLSSILAFFVYEQINQEKRREHLEAEKEIMQISYKAIKDSFKTHAEMLFLNKINTPEIKEIFSKATDKNPEVVNQARDDLYEKLIDVYNGMRLFKLKQLHFHLPNNDSFLRFHRPNKYGDNLSQIRNTVAYVNRTLEPIYGFEEGRIFNGYRFVFPVLSSDNAHYGSVETSVSMKTIIEYFVEKINGDIDFIIKKDIVENKVFRDERENYIDADLFTGFLYEKSVSKIGNPEINKIVEKYYFQEPSNKSILDEKLKQGEVFSFYVWENSKHIIVTFLPINNKITKRNVGYLIIKRNHKHVNEAEIETMIFLIIILTLISLVIYIYHNLEKNKVTLNDQNLILNDVQKIAHVGFWTLDIPTNKIEWSEEIYKIFDLNNKETKLTYEKFLEFVHPDDREKVNLKYMNSIENRENYFLTYRIIRRNGTVVYVEHEVSHSFNQKGEIIKSIGVMRDVSEVKNYEKQLNEVKSQYDSLIKSIPEAIFRCNIDKDWSMLHLSSSISDITGYNPSDFILNRVRSFESIVHAQDKKVFNNKIISVDKKTKEYTIEYRVVQLSGETVWVREKGKIVENQNGLNFIEGIIININSQKKAYEKLHKFINIQKNIVIMSDSKNNIKFANKPFFEFFNYTSIEDFMNETKCVCFRFVENDEYFHLNKLGNQPKKEELWLEYLLKLPNKDRVVVMLNHKNQLFYFSITINKFEEDMFVISLEDITKVVLSKNKIQKEVGIDTLTQAYNNNFLKNNYTHVVKAIESTGKKVGLILVDIDNFKNINRDYGHKKGDEVLVELSQLLTSNLEHITDILIRWNGQEFLIFKKTKDLESLKLETELIRKSIESYKFSDINSKITCSFGLNIYNPQEDVIQNIQNVSQALKESKNRGKNKISTVRSGN